MGANVGCPIDNRPTGKLVLGINQLDLVSGTEYKVQFASTLSQFKDNIEDTVNYRIKPNRPGFYLVIAQVTFMSVVADKKYQMNIMHKDQDASWTPWARDIRHSRTTDDLTCGASDIIWIGNDLTYDAFEVFATQFSGVNTVDIRGDALSTFLIVQRLR